jgi:membrane protein
MVLLLMSFFMVGAIVLPAFEVIKSSALSFSMFSYLGIGLVDDILISVISFILIFIMFFIFYDFIPYENFNKKVPAIAALSATILWEIARRIFGFYIAHIGSLNKIYGAYALTIVVAFWIYYTSIVLIIGAEIGQLYRERLEQISILRSFDEKT